jgi:hypothetical protein
MKTKLFKEIYQLLEDIAPDMLEENEEYYLIHEFEDSPYPMYIKSFGECVAMGRMNFDEDRFPVGPLTYIIHNNEEKIASFLSHRPVKNGEPYQMEFYVDENIDDENNANHRLKQYLTDLKYQISKSKDEPFFRKVDYQVID